jgi:hypothetical protein
MFCEAETNKGVVGWGEGTLEESGRRDRLH